MAGIRAVDPYTIVAEALRRAPGEATGENSAVTVVAAGKGAAAMARAAADTLGDRIDRGVILAPVPVDAPSARWRVYRGGHPIPSDEGVRAAREIHQLVCALDGSTTLLCLISGGASALMMLPPDDVPLADAQAVTTALLRAGATIAELNCVRKHIDQLKGGRLARLAAPAAVVALILSDVVGDPLDVIASGPTVPDPTTIADAIGILRNRGVWEQTPASVRRHLESGGDESPKPGDSCFATTVSVLVGNNGKAAEAARAHAESLGYDATVVTTTLTGESRDVGASIAQHALALQAHRAPNAPPQCLVYAGETTVTVTGSGIGGRNQELALAAAIVLDGSRGITLASIGTDGIDGPTDAAGAVADGRTLPRARALGEARSPAAGWLTQLLPARALGLDASRALATNDAYPFWRALGDLVITGPTGTNVMDLIVVTIA